MSTPKFPSHEEAKQAGWFSRRHRTREESEAAKTAHLKEIREAAATKKAAAI